MDVFDWLRALAALGVTLALIGLAAVAARRLNLLQPAVPGGGERRMRVRERLMLDPRRQLALVEVDGEEHLLLLSPFGDRAIARKPARPAPEGEEGAP